MPECYFKHLGGCEGRLVKAHLIPKQRIKRELKTSDKTVIWDERVWVWMCGGSNYGAEGHHGQFDNKQIRLNYVELPQAVKEYAEEYGLQWSLERDYVL